MMNTGVVSIIKNMDLRTIANSGQCFRISEVYDGEFNVIAGDKFVRVEKLEENTYKFCCEREEYDNFWYNYFDLGTDYTKYMKISRDDDEFLQMCIKNSKGLRILKQNKFETVISFIISQRKSVKAIMTSIDRLSRTCGKKIVNKYGEFWAFPTAYEILRRTYEEINSCGFGYRTNYILEFCKNWTMGFFDLDSFDSLSDEELINKLMTINGVGIKVASCIALFAYGRVGVCPIDVWIKRVLDDKYNGKIPDEYEKYAGIIQQYWFNYIRLHQDCIKINKKT